MKYLKNIVGLLIVFLFLGFQEVPKMKEADTNAILKASYIYNFAKLIDWPENDKTGNFIIGVYGNSTVYKELMKKYSSKSIGKQQIEIKKLSDTPSIGKVHLLYISKDKEGDLEKLLKSIDGSSVLIVTESYNALDIGSIINFIVINNSLKFELNIGKANEHNLSVGTVLKDLAFKK